MPRRTTVQRMSAVAVAAAGAIFGGTARRAAGVRRRVDPHHRTGAGHRHIDAAPVADGHGRGHRHGRPPHRRLPRASTCRPKARAGRRMPRRAPPTASSCSSPTTPPRASRSATRSVTGPVSEFNTVTQITASTPRPVELVQAGYGPARDHAAARRPSSGGARGRSRACSCSPAAPTASFQPQPAALRRALAERGQRAAGRGVRDRSARDDRGEQHHAANKAAACSSTTATASRSASPTAPTTPTIGRPALPHEGHRRAQRRHGELPVRAAPS